MLKKCFTAHDKSAQGLRAMFNSYVNMIIAFNYNFTQIVSGQSIVCKPLTKPAY